MLFNTIDFAVFLPIVFIVYWLVTRGSLKLQNSLIVVASYLFYGWWDWRFLALILFSTIVDYTVGLKLGNENNATKRKALLWTSVLLNLGFLGFFKYYNFFLDNFITAFSFFGTEIHANSLDIILPIGISFYTFQTLSYTLDVYKRKLEPTEDFIAFSAFVSFFPQLVAGPIERATNLLPQFYTKRVFDYSRAVDGSRQILWGLFKKIVIADNCAELADVIFNNSSDATGSSLVIGAVFFTFQIYGDFSGYSDIAIGTARLFGFNLKQNFAFPYFSRDIGEFWRRWHISLSTWFRDYLYIPMGGNRVGRTRAVQNVLVIFIASGFWHGANWTFILWGFVNAIYFIPIFLAGTSRKNLDTIAKDKVIPSYKELSQMVFTFVLIVFAWIFFRAENLSQVYEILQGIFSKTILEFKGSDFIGTSMHPFTMSVFLGIFILMEWIGREGKHALETFGLKWRRPFRYAMYYMIVILILSYAGKEQQFIYFQF